MKRLIIIFVLLMLFLTACGGSVANDRSSSELLETIETDSVLGIKDSLIADNFEFTISSAKTCTSIVNALGITYDAESDNEFLIVFFEAKNIANDTMNVMNTNFNGYVDKKKVNISVIVGEIEGCMPLLGAVSSGMSFNGYAVWELPKGWDKFEFSYIDALTGSESETITINSTDIN